MLLNQLWPLVNDRLNYFTPTKKPVGWATGTAGRSKRVYDKPATPLDRLLAADVLSPAQEAELTARRDALNPAELARRIQSIQDRLTGLARDAMPCRRPSTSRSPTPPAASHSATRADPTSRAFLVEAPIRFCGHLDLRHHGVRAWIG